VEVKEGEFKVDGIIHKAEYETMGMFGSNLLNDNLESIFKVNDICNRYGMDTIGCGGLVAYAIECYENGYISRDQADGLDLRWGNASAIVELVEKIGKAEGIGAVLAKGFDNAVEIFGEETRKYAVAVRNEGLPAHDPRWNVGLALTYYIDATPGRHCQGSTAFPVAGYDMPEIPPNQSAGRGKPHMDNANWAHVLDSAGLCLFGYAMLDHKSLPEFLKAADGKDWTLEELDVMGRKLTILRNLFNNKAGLTFDRYDFPVRVLTELDTGPTKGVKIDLQTLTHEYLETAGLSAENGLPPESVMKELNIESYL
jgi:aldehyde:ferredoxin oxidoreductase